ncbi:outer membrane protein [Pseudomonas sp. TCU-HL1]|nr:outer membrane protein [Pseudomonas sp. TCU-HL1]
MAQAESATQAALAHFDGVVLNALRETQTALAQYEAALQQHAALEETARSARLSAEQTHAFYAAGRESFLAELDAQRTLATIDEQLAASQGQVTQAQIGLFMALGGGWQQTEPGT